MNKCIIYLFCFIMVFLFNIKGISCSSKDLNTYHRYDKETTSLVLKVEKLKDKYYLEYKDLDDLSETCYLIKEYSKYTNFDKYDILSIAIKEGKLNQYALNKNDGGKGLMQLTKIKVYHKDTLFWINDPYDKHQNIIGACILLEENLRGYKTKQVAIKRYNGSTYKSTLYAESVSKLKKEIIKI